MAPSRYCNKHISNGYFTTTALQVIERKEKTCEAGLEELMDMFSAIKSEYSPKISVVEGVSDAAPLDFDSPTRLASDNYYVLTGLIRKDFDNLCSCPSTCLTKKYTKSNSTYSCGMSADEA